MKQVRLEKRVNKGLLDLLESKVKLVILEQKVGVEYLDLVLLHFYLQMNSLSLQILLVLVR